MKTKFETYLNQIHLPEGDSHKGQNGRLLVIGGSQLFHAASIWALEVASRIVDLVHYSSTPENNAIVQSAKEQFRNGIIIPRSDIEAYIEEDDCILIGPGMTRDSETRDLTHRLLTQYPNKQWVIDAGALQMMELADVPKNAILTPHHGEFKQLCDKAGDAFMDASAGDQTLAQQLAIKHECIVLLKGPTDTICSPQGNVERVSGGNSGMTKGGTGDVLAGLVAAFACQSDPFVSAVCGSVVNKAAGDVLYKTVGPFFNASDLAKQVPLTLASYLRR